jgi:integrase/recombinase XerD
VHVLAFKIMEINKLLITFVIAKSRMNKSGYCPLRCRITYKGEIYEFSTGEFVKPDCWYSKLQVAKPLVQENVKINTSLSQIKSKINQVYLLLVHSTQDFFLDDIVNQLKPQPKSEEKLIIGFFDEYVSELRMRIGYDYKLATIWKYEQSRNLLSDYLRSIRKKDYPIKEINLNFINKYELFLKVNKKLAVATVYKTLQRLKKVTTVALQRDFISKDPFIGYKFTRPKTEIQYVRCQKNWDTSF